VGWRCRFGQSDGYDRDSGRLGAPGNWREQRFDLLHAGWLLPSRSGFASGPRSPASGRGVRRTAVGLRGDGREAAHPFARWRSPQLPQPAKAIRTFSSWSRGCHTVMDAEGEFYNLVLFDGWAERGPSPCSARHEGQIFEAGGRRSSTNRRLLRPGRAGCGGWSARFQPQCGWQDLGADHRLRIGARLVLS